MSAPIDDHVRGVAALDHPVTNAVYRLLVDHGEVSREQVATTLDVARSVAAFHLDKLVDVGIAEVRYARLTGRTGPGAGRTAKVYRRSEREITVALPERHYDVAGGLLADAIERASVEGVPVARALRDAATETGQQIGEAARAATEGRRSKAARRDALLQVLEHHGYEPRVRGGEIVMANCPFHALAERHRDLVCGMNLDLLSGIIDGVGGDVVTARLAPEPGFCCVRMTAR